jgi:hypothetical protein
LAALALKWRQLVDPTRAGLLDEDSAPAVDRGDGGDDLQRLDLRSSASARHQIKVAHPLMLRAIAAAKKKNDQIDASKIADCLRGDFLPECHMMPAEIRDRRRTLRYLQRFARVPDDLQQAFKIDAESMMRFESQLASYSLGWMSPIPDMAYDREFLALKLASTKHDWCLWEDLAEFCEKAGESIEAFSVELDFARLDEAASNSAPPRSDQ